MSDQRTTFEFGQNTPAHRLAALLQAIDDMQAEKKDSLADWFVPRSSSSLIGNVKKCARSPDRRHNTPFPHCGQDRN